MNRHHARHHPPWFCPSLTAFVSDRTLNAAGHTTHLTHRDLDKPVRRASDRTGQ